MAKFKKYLLTENQEIINNKIANLITGVDSLQEDMLQMGNRQVIKNLTQIANEIRKILNDEWADTETDVLKFLQKVAFFILNSIDSNTELKNIIDKVAIELHNMATERKIQINQLNF